MTKKPTRSPQKDSATTARGKAKVEWKGYVNFTLTESMQNGFKEFAAKSTTHDALIEELVQDGFDLKVRYDDYNKCFSAQLYCTDAARPEAGWCLSLRADSWYKAVLRLLYVHYIALEERWNAQVEIGWTDEKW